MKLLSRLVLVITLAATTVAAQTKVTPPKNKYTPQQDVQIGREAAQEVREQYPLITDSQIRGYLERLGERLVDAAPRDLNHDAFEYSFTPVNLKDINAFALPGGPMFVNRGMIEAAQDEGEVAGVMAHELAHVLLRHGTANATKAQGFQIGAIAGAIAGAVIGGGWGEAIARGSQFGLGTWLLKYSRDYEKQADLLGAQIMARAGYDPRDLARMFETIQKQGKGSPPQWLSSHPNPGNRTQYINAEAQQLRIAERPDTGGFQQVRSRFASLPPARTMAEMERGGGRNGEGVPASVGRVGEPVPMPSRQYRTVQGGQLFQVQVPSNWQAVQSNNAIKYVPQNGYGEYRGQVTLTHGVELGVARASTRDLNQATQTLIDGFIRSNEGLQFAGRQDQGRIANRVAIRTPLIGRSAIGGRERVDVYTTQLRDGNLFYVITVVPEREEGNYTAVFNRVVQTVRLNDR
ncbi:MAG TPA: M48 family metallopeptidase [Vicinamibacterales bacterium]|nr:M48 family metallopeptidase [Vicinamibacterales bacterium]